MSTLGPYSPNPSGPNTKCLLFKEWDCPASNQRMQSSIFRADLLPVGVETEVFLLWERNTPVFYGYAICTFADFVSLCSRESPLEVFTTLRSTYT